MLLDARIQWIVVGISLGVYLTPAWYLGDLTLSEFWIAAFSVGVAFIGIAILQWVYIDQLVGTNQALQVEIAEKQESQGALKASERNYREIFDASLDGISVHDFQTGETLDVNQRFCELYECTREEALSLGLEQFYIGEPPCPLEHAFDFVRETLKEGTQVFEWLAKRSSGELFWVELRSKLATIDDQECILVFVRDISQRKRVEQTLIESEARYRGLFDNALETILIADDEAFFVDANPAATEMLGYDREEILRMSLWDLILSSEHEPTREGWRDFLTRGEQSGILSLNQADGGKVEVEYQAVANFQPGLHLSIMHDITKRVKAERALRHSLEETAHNQRLLLALSQAAQAVQRVRTLEQIYATVGREVANVGYHAVIFTSTREGAYLELSYFTFEPSVARILKQMTGLSARDYLIPVRLGGFYDGLIKTEQPIFVGRLERPLAETLPAEKRALTPEVLALLEIEQAIYAPLVVDGQLCGILMVTGLGLRETDVPAVSAFANQAAAAIESTRLLDQVLTGRERLQELAKRLVTAQEEERRHLSRELHDEAGQALTALKIDLELIKSDLLEDPTQLRRRLTRAANLTDVIQERLRSTAQGLRPPALDVTGLNVTLEDYCQNFRDRTQLEITYQGVDLTELPEITEITLYRFVQESLTNIARHARASQIQVRLQETNGAASLSVEDDGIGFDTQAILSTLHSGDGMGLLGVRERLELVGGWLDVDSRPGEGTRLVAHVPVEKDYLERRRER
jgi:PAS domain S-box-containing protein